MSEEHNKEIPPITTIPASVVTYNNLAHLLVSRGMTLIDYVSVAENDDAMHQFRNRIDKDGHVIFEAKGKDGTSYSVIHIFMGDSALNSDRFAKAIKKCPLNDVIAILPEGKNPKYHGDKNIIRIHDNYLWYNMTKEWENRGTKVRVLTDEECHKTTNLMFRGSKFDLRRIDLYDVHSVWLGLEIGQVIEVETPTQCCSGVEYNMLIVEYVSATH
jgi:hypothetical protein